MWKSFISLILVVTLLLTVTPMPLVYAEDSTQEYGGLDLWVVNSLKNVYRTSTIPQYPVESINIVSAMNEYEGAQIALRSDKGFDIAEVKFSNLVSGKNKIKGSNLRYGFEEYELKDTAKESVFWPDNAGKSIYPKTELPDPISNEKSIHVAANSTQPIYITSYVPSSQEGTNPGLYTGTVTVETTLGEYTVPISIEVANVEIPKTSEANFVNFLWADTMGFTGDSFQWENYIDARNGRTLYDVGHDYYGVETYSVEWWKLMKNFADVMTAHRQNMVLIRTDLLLQATGTKLSDFKEKIPEYIDWSVFDRYIQMFIDAGMTDFANIHLNHAVNMILEENNESYYKNNVTEWDKVSDTTKAKIDKFLQNYLGALRGHLEEKGWLDGKYQWYQNITDEPNNTYFKNYWTYIANDVDMYAPEFKTADADPGGILMAEDSKPYVDVWVPLTPAFQSKKDLYKAEQSAGKDLWVYTCDVNQSPWLNRLWTQPTLTGRLLFWNLSQDGVTGHLHWAWNVWSIGNWYGDSTIVYPDTVNMTVKSSLRYEAQRDGIEDYELMYKLKQINPELAKKITDSAINPDDPRKYTLDTEYIGKLHDYLVRAAAGEAAGDIPVPTSPYDGQDMSMTYMVDNTNSDIDYTGKWFEKSHQYAYLSSINSTSEAGNYLDYKFIGSGIDVVIEKNDRAGKFSVKVDGLEPVIVDAYEKVQHDYFTIYSNRSLSKGSHTIRIVNLENKSLSFDCFRVQMYEGQKLYDASLKSLEIGNAPSFTFNSGIKNYQIMIPEDVNTISIKPVLSDVNGTIAINGTRFEDGMIATADIPIGKSVIKIQCTASDGETTKLYTLNFLKGNENTPESNIARNITEITASATRDGDQGTTYGPAKMVDGDYGTQFASKQGYISGHPFPHTIDMTWSTPQSFNTVVMATWCGLIQGVTNIDVQVPDENGAWKTIAENVPVKWKNTDSTYEIEYTYANIPAVSNVTKVRLLINDAYYTSWDMYGIHELELYNLPDNGEIAVNVTYDASLKNLEISNVSSFNFDSSVTDYQIMLPKDAGTISITSILTDERGTIVINGKSIGSGMTATAEIPLGKSEIKILNTAIDGVTTKLYTLNFLKGNENTIESNIARSCSSITSTATRDGDGGIAYGPDKMIDGNYNTEFASERTFTGADAFPHEIEMIWSTPQSFNTIVMATFCGLVQGITNIDVQIPDGNGGWNTVAENIPIKWKNTDSTYEIEYTYADIPAVSNVTRLRILVNDANYTSWSMYGIHELELYNLPDNGEIAVSVQTITGT